MIRFHHCKAILAAGCLLIVSGCVTLPPATPLIHTFVVKDEEGKLVQGARVETEEMWGAQNDYARPVCTTDQTGTCRFPPMYSMFGNYGGLPYTTVQVKITKDGYLPNTVFDDQGGGGSKMHQNNGLNSTLVSAKTAITLKVGARDLQKRPLGDVSINAQINDRSGRCVTDSAGSCQIPVEFVRKDRSNYKVTFDVAATGRYSKKQTKELPSGIKSDITEIVLDQPADYLCDALQTAQNQALAKQMTEWVDALRVKAIIQDTVIAHGNFCTTNFKNKKYASVKLDHTSVFNSLKLNNYQIGVRMFDEVVRKMLDVVAPAVASLPLDGYDLMIQTATGDATEKYADKKTLTYRFYLPKQAVQKYKDKDITGQQLIDASVVLLNEERIDLKLQ